MGISNLHPPGPGGNRLYDRDAEQAVLCAMLLEPVAPQRLEAAMFADPKHRALYAAAMAIHGRGLRVEPIALRAELDRAGQLDAAGGLEYVAALIDTVPTAKHIEQHAAIVRQLALRRELSDLAATVSAPNARPETWEAAGNRLNELLCALRDSSSAPAFSPPTLAEFAAENPTVTEWVVPTLAAREAVTVVAGHPKAGKTTMLAEVAGAVAACANFAGHETHGGSVLWIDLEQPKGLTASVLQAHCLPSAPVHVQWGSLPGFDAMGTFCQKAQVNLVVVDSWTKARAGVDDANDEVQTERALRPWLDFARRNRVAVVFIHHLRKSGGSEGLDLRGSGALAQTVDIVVVFKRYAQDSETDSRRVLEVFSRFGTSKTVLERVEGRYRPCGTPGQVRRQAERDKVLAVLTDQPQTAAEIATSAELSAAAARTVLNLLSEEPEESRLVERSGAGRKGDAYRYKKSPIVVRNKKFYRRTSILEEEGNQNTPSLEGVAA